MPIMNGQNPNTPRPKVALAMAAIFGPVLVYFIESLIFSATQFSLPLPIARTLYPPYSKLAEHCVANPCLYKPAGVASLYAVQLFTLFFHAMIVSFLVGRSKQKVKPLDKSVLIFVVIVMAAVTLNYIVGSFDFDSHTTYPNRVANYPSGLYYYIFQFWFAGIAVLLLSAFIKSRGGSHGRS